MALIEPVTTSWTLAIVNILVLMIINFASDKKIMIGFGWGLVAFNLILILLTI